MKPRERVADLLAEVIGFPVHPDDLHAAKGYWSHAQQDVHRWEATLPVPPDRDAEYRVNVDPKQPWIRVYHDVCGLRQEHVMLVCDDSMKECVKRGIRIERDGYKIVVSAKHPKDTTK